VFAEILQDPFPEARRSRRAAPPPLPHVAQFNDWREQIQRPFTGSKKANVPKYRRYLREVIEGRRYGTIPEIQLWAGPEPLLVEPSSPNSSHAFLTVPMRHPIIPIDGETQVAARFDLFNESPAFGTQARIVARLNHGIPIEAAKQIFFDCNTQGVNVSPSTAILRDNYDPINGAARELAAIVAPHVDLLHVRQAVCWSMYHKLTNPVRRQPTFDADLAASAYRLRDRLAMLAPRLASDMPLRNVVLFIACTDPRVTVAEVDMRQRDDPFWRSVKNSTAGVEATIAHLRQPRLPSLDESEPEPLAPTSPLSATA
jgi:hypothetical protein